MAEKDTAYHGLPSIKELRLELLFLSHAYNHSCACFSSGSGMSEITVILTCEDHVEFCREVAKRLGEKTLYKVVADDWRRPIVDGLLASMLYYEGEVDEAKIKKIFEILGYQNLYNAVTDVLSEKKGE